MVADAHPSASGVGVVALGPQRQHGQALDVGLLFQCHLDRRQAEHGADVEVLRGAARCAL